MSEMGSKPWRSTHASLVVTFPLSKKKDRVLSNVSTHVEHIVRIGVDEFVHKEGLGHASLLVCGCTVDVAFAT